MIKCDNHTCNIRGNGAELLTELTLIVRSFHRSNIDSDIIRESVEMGLLSDDEIEEKCKQERMKMLAFFMKEMADIKDLEDEKE